MWFRFGVWTGFKVLRCKLLGLGRAQGSGFWIWMRFRVLGLYRGKGSGFEVWIKCRVLGLCLEFGSGPGCRVWILDRVHASGSRLMVGVLGLGLQYVIIMQSGQR